MVVAADGRTATVLLCDGCGRPNRVPPVGMGWPRCGGCRWVLPWLAEAGDDSFPEVAEAAQLPVLVSLWAPWGAPCRAVARSLERLARELSGQVKLVQVNVDEAPGVAGRFAVGAVPMLLVLGQGRVTARQAWSASCPGCASWTCRPYTAERPVPEAVLDQADRAYACDAMI